MNYKFVHQNIEILLPYFVFGIERGKDFIKVKSGGVHSVHDDEMIEIDNRKEKFPFEEEFYLQVRLYSSGSVESCRIVPLSEYGTWLATWDQDLMLMLPFAKLSREYGYVTAKYFMFDTTIYLPQFQLTRGFCDGVQLRDLAHISFTAKRADVSYPFFIETLNYYRSRSGSGVPAEIMEFGDLTARYYVETLEEVSFSYSHTRSQIPIGFFEGNNYITLGPEYPDHAGAFWDYDQDDESWDRYYKDVYGKPKAELLQSYGYIPNPIFTPGTIEGPITFVNHYEFF